MGSQFLLFGGQFLVDGLLFDLRLAGVVVADRDQTVVERAIQCGFLQIESFLEDFELGLGLRLDDSELRAGRILLGTTCGLLLTLAIDPLTSRHHAGDALHVLGGLAGRGLFLGAPRAGQRVQPLLGCRQFLLPLRQVLPQRGHRRFVELDVEGHKRHRSLAGIDLLAGRVDQFLNPCHLVAGALDLGAVENQVADTAQADPQRLQRSGLVGRLAHGIRDVGQFRQEVAGERDAEGGA